MDYDQLKANVKEIAEIAASVPEPFRDKCFELLLVSLLREEGSERMQKETQSAPPTPLPTTPPAASEGVRTGSGTIPMKAQLRLLMKKTDVTPEEVERVVMYDNGEVHFVKEPHDVGIAAGQMEWALLLALKNTILKDSMSADPEDVRSVCQAKGFYDKANFAAIFKKPKYTKLFKSALVPQGPAEPLSSEGQDALGKLIERLADESS